MNSQGTTSSIGYPSPKACMSVESAAQAIVTKLLTDDGPLIEDDERAEVQAAQNILAALNRLQASLTQATDQQRSDIASIRAAASSLVNSHLIK
jgi:hypothetical protein